LPEFVLRTLIAQRQTLRATGFVGGRLLVDANRTFWTLTVWENEQAMKKFRGAGAHAKVMPKLAIWCDEASFAHWNSDNAAVPSWSEAYERLMAEGHLSRVTYPSKNHEARHFQKPRLQPEVGQELKPIASTAKARGIAR
jgi:heme-degrading monooxygenase HmoA